MRAAGVGTGAPDINAKYHDGYATSLTATSSTIYVSDANGGLPQIMPAGSIIMFDVECPSGWTRVTALDGKFLVASSTYSAAAGGADSITLTTTNMPAHTHTGTTSSDGAHTHSMVTVSNSNVGTTYVKTAPSGGNGTKNTGSSGSHTHTFTTASTGSGTAFDNRPAYATIILCKKD